MIRRVARRAEWVTLLTFIALVGTLVAGLWSLRLVPFYRPFLGLDLQNIYAFHHCPTVQDAGLYVVSGLECGDVTGRPFRYPPSLYYWFWWVRAFPFSQAATLWISVSGLAMAVVGVAWAWMDDRIHRSWRAAGLAIVWLLLLVQFPFVFALERGQSDIIPVVLWTVTVILFVRSRYVLAGGAAGVAVAAKIFPAIALAVVVVGAVRMNWRVVVLITLGSMVGGLLVSVLWPGDTIRFLTIVLPGLSKVINPLTLISHPLRALAAPYALVTVLGIALFGSWAIAAWRQLSSQPLLVFAGALAISTYFSGISYDYNLITTYPLLLLVAARALDAESSLAWSIASVASIITIVAGRGLFTPSVQLLLQVVTLVAIAWLTALDGSKGDQAHGTLVGKKASIPDDQSVS
ncbi:MAG: glycosyltransferase 87 family protein [Actinomycetia bacterium]|nr:glycosyltransferase 87 family protein [Actinomycetes bacterium]